MPLILVALMRVIPVSAEEVKEVREHDQVANVTACRKNVACDRKCVTEKNVTSNTMRSDLISDGQL